MQGDKCSSGRGLTTQEVIPAESAIVRHVIDGRDAAALMLSPDRAEETATSRDFLNDAQRVAIREVLTSTDRVHGLQGLSGAGKRPPLLPSAKMPSMVAIRSKTSPLLRRQLVSLLSEDFAPFTRRYRCDLSK